MADYQPIKGLKREKFSLLSLSGSPNRPAERVRKPLSSKRYMQGDFALCGDDADVRERIRHAVSVALMLVNTAYFCATTSCLELVPGLMLYSGDGDWR